MKINEVLKRLWREAVVTYSRYYPGIRLQKENHEQLQLIYTIFASRTELWDLLNIKQEI
jgi:hypothetical protein